MFKQTLIAGLVVAALSGTAVANDADSLADKALTDLQMDTVTAGDVVPVDTLSLNFEAIKFEYSRDATSTTFGELGNDWLVGGTGRD